MSHLYEKYDHLRIDAINFKIDDLILLERFIQGDEGAFWVIWLKYREEFLNNYCVRWLNGNWEESEDVLSAASIKAFQVLPHHASKIIHVKSWLLRLIYNQCMDIHRIHKKRKILSNDIKTMRTSQEVIPLNISSPEDKLIQQEMHERVKDGIAQLPPKLQEISSLRFLLGLPSCTIADQLYLSPENVRKRIQQARNLLQEILRVPIRQGQSPEVISSPESQQPLSASGQVYRCEHADPRYQMITPRNRALRVIPIRHHGIELCVQVAIDHKPARQQQKLDTLREYVKRHPRGWKKHIMLADILYLAGVWEESIIRYKQVINKNVYCLGAHLRLGEMYHTLLQKK
ncbi:MAG: hypothetical protein ETSY1_00850 [Candidatus Entotheonella factor]|uniref:RNA polymerase sigma factor 70 region 4 type 2 domain-containing protein n=1 Tax=Entotheonella factor TaxID=1429438 RepID=W4LZ38_ENTF1|nr:MAG: hypothetical protein ETSY1_00850 [Candidatus Entotheonella factor]